MWVPEPLTRTDVADLAQIAATIASAHTSRVLEGKLDEAGVDPELGLSLAIEATGTYISVALRRAGLVISPGSGLARWPVAVRPAAVALWDVLIWASDSLLEAAPLAMSKLLEALREEPGRAELLSSPDLFGDGMGFAGWTEWADDAVALIRAATT